MPTSRFRPEPGALVALVGGVVLLALLLWVQGTWETTLEQSLPGRDALAQVRAELTKAHLALEEALGGETAYTAEQAWSGFDRARSALLAAASAPDRAASGRAGRLEDLVKRL
ncbi:MAG: hypothetical protein HQK87_09300, partial [Nitrospinae bacterium]|nr:hypothetical protein [Nitrospinota bacterium]